MVTYDRVRNTIATGYHEWAWSRRTSGFGVYAVVEKGGLLELINIGETQKRPTIYRLPPNTIAVVRRYASFKGYNSIFIYPLWKEEIEELAVEEANDFHGDWETLLPEEEGKWSPSDIQKLEKIKQLALQHFQLPEVW